MDMLESWLDESYRAQAPKKLIAQLDGTPASRAANSTKKEGDDQEDGQPQPSGADANR